MPTVPIAKKSQRYLFWKNLIMAEEKIWLSYLYLQCYRHRHWLKDISDVAGAQALQLSVMVMLISSYI